MTAHTEDPWLHKLSAELLHRHQGDTVQEEVSLLSREPDAGIRVQVENS